MNEVRGPGLDLAQDVESRVAGSKLAGRGRGRGEVVAVVVVLEHGEGGGSAVEIKMGGRSVECGGDESGELVDGEAVVLGGVDGGHRLGVAGRSRT